MESAGAFTLDRSKAWEKLGSFQLPFPTAWVIKIVQAANLLIDSVLEIAQTREATIFKMTRAPGWARPAVEAAIFNPNHEVDRALSHLAVGLRSLAQLKTRPFSVCYPDGEHVAWDGRAFQELEKGEADGVFVLAVAHFEFGESSSIFNLGNMVGPKYSQSINSTLCCRCHLGPHSLKVDGREIGNLLQDPVFGVTGTSRPLALLRVPEMRMLPTFTVANPLSHQFDKLGQHQVSVTASATGFEPGEPARPVAALGLLSVAFEKVKLRRNDFYYAPGVAHSEIIWLNDGVVVARESLKDVKGPVAVGIVVSCQGLETDVSGLIPRKSTEMILRKHLAIKHTMEELRSFVNTLGAELVNVEKGGATSSIVRGLLGVGVTVIMPLFGLALIGKAWYDYSSNDRRAKDLDVAFDQGLKTLLHQLTREERATAPF